MKRLFAMAVAALPAFAMAQLGMNLNLNKQNLQVFNAASVGLDDQLNTGLFYKNHWPGISGKFLSTGVFGSYRIKSITSGVGLHYTYNTLNDFIDEHRLAGSFAKHLKVGSGTLSAGMDATFIRHDVDLAKVTWHQFHDLSNYRDGSTIDVGAGLIYQTDKFETGLSVKNILEANLFDHKSTREVFGHMLYHARIGEKLKVSPMAVVSHVEGFNSIQLNTTVTLNERIWIMGGYKNRDAWVAGLGIDLPKGIRLAYSYDQSFPRLTRATRGSHEFLVGFRIPDKPIK